MVQVEPGENKTNYYVTESVGIACGLMLAALHEAGLATLTHTPSPMGFLRDICRRPSDEKPVMVIVAGLPASDATVPTHALRKKPLDRISSWGWRPGLRPDADAPIWIMDAFRDRFLTAFGSQ